MLRSGPALLLALSTFLASARSVLAANAPAAFPGFAATRVTLGNGMRVVLAPDSLSGVVDASLWIRAGTRHEAANRAGLALLAARLTFRNGSPDPLAPLEAEGGTGSLAVTPDVTCLSATVPAPGLDAALAFLAVRLPGRPVTASEVAAERAALRSTRLRTDRSAVARGLARLWSAAWPGHPYARTGASSAPSDEAGTVANVEAWRRERLQPGNAVLTLTGGFDPASALAQVRARFERLPRGAGAGSGGRAPSPGRAGRAGERMEVPARLCLVGWRGPGASDPDGPAIELLASCLGGGSQARLSTSLVRDWGLAITTQAGYLPQQDGSLLWSLAVVAPGADSAAVERTLLDAVRGLSQRAPEAFELERARRQLLSTVYFGLQTARQRGQAVGEAEVLAGDAAMTSRRLAALGQVTPDDIRRVAARIMTDAGRATVWLLPAAAGGAR
jgi:zinc protease